MCSGKCKCKKSSMVQVSIEGDSEAQDVAKRLVWMSTPFSVEPMPNDEFIFTVRPEIAPIIEPTKVQNLFDYIPQGLSQQPGYCSAVDYYHKLGKMRTSYMDWERDVGGPALLVAGFTDICWVDGESDGFGLLSRRAICKRGGQEFDLIYG